MAYEQTRIIAAMAALGQFTVAMLVEESGAKEATVRTTLGRESRLVEVVSTEATGRRGGRPKVYSLVPGAQDEILSRLRVIDESTRRSTREARWKAGAPDALIIAEDQLLNAITDEVDPDRRASLLRRARRQLEAVSTLGVSEYPDTPAAGRLTAARWLYRLAEEEHRSGAGNSESDPAVVERLRAEFKSDVWPDLVTLLADQDDSGLLYAYISRAMSSALFRDEEIWKIFPPAAPGYVVVVDDESDDDHAGVADPVTASVVKYLSDADVKHDIVHLGAFDEYVGEIPDLLLFTMACRSQEGKRSRLSKSRIELTKLFELIDNQSMRIFGPRSRLDSAIVTDQPVHQVALLAARHRKRFVSIDDVPAGFLGDTLFGSLTAVSAFERATTTTRPTSNAGSGDLPSAEMGESESPKA